MTIFKVYDNFMLILCLPLFTFLKKMCQLHVKSVSSLCFIVSSYKNDRLDVKGLQFVNVRIVEWVYRWVNFSQNYKSHLIILEAPGHFFGNRGVGLEFQKSICLYSFLFFMK